MYYVYINIYVHTYSNKWCNNIRYDLAQSILQFYLWDSNVSPCSSYTFRFSIWETPSACVSLGTVSYPVICSRLGQRLNTTQTSLFASESESQLSHICFLNCRIFRTWSGGKKKVRLLLLNLALLLNLHTAFRSSSTAKCGVFALDVVFAQTFCDKQIALDMIIRTLCADM